MERKRGQRYSSEFRRQAVERMNACDNIVRLSQELGVARRLLYNWRERLDETSPPPHRGPGHSQGYPGRFIPGRRRVSWMRSGPQLRFGEVYWSVW